MTKKRNPKTRRAARRRTADPAVPALCAARPLHGGMVVPWITGWVNGRPYFGVNLPIRRVQAITHGLCQIDGRPLGRRIGLVVRPADIEAGWIDEPGMHPECLEYSIRACPMLNGSMNTHRARPPAAVAGILALTGPRHGQAADAYEAWFISPNGYRIAYADNGDIRGLRLDVPVLMRRPVRAAARSPLTEEHAASLRQFLDLICPDLDPAEG